MTKAEEYFNELINEFPDLKPGKMFGASCIKTHAGKSAAMLWKDCLVVKLKSEQFEEALKLTGSKPFEPMDGKKMKEWVQIPFLHKNRWKEYIICSASYVEHLKL